jgi:hypothetical protein
MHDGAPFDAGEAALARTAGRGEAEAYALVPASRRLVLVLPMSDRLDSSTPAIYRRIWYGATMTDGTGSDAAARPRR